MLTINDKSANELFVTKFIITHMLILRFYPNIDNNYIRYNRYNLRRFVALRLAKTQILYCSLKCKLITRDAVPSIYQCNDTLFRPLLYRRYVHHMVDCLLMPLVLHDE